MIMPTSPLKISRLAASPEGRIFLCGIATLLILLTLLGLSTVWLPGKTHILLAITGADIMVGRATGMYLGFCSDVNPAIVVAINFFVDSIWVLILYPTVILGMRRMLKINFFKKAINRVIDAAEHHRALIERYGKPGLFLFVLCPLPMTGPVVGSVVGNLMGLKPGMIVAVVLSATYAAIGLWAILLSKAHQVALTYGSRMPVIFFILLICLVLIGRIVHQYTAKHKSLNTFR